MKFDPNSLLVQPHTVMGYLLHDCPLDILHQEAEAGRWLKAGGGTSSTNFAKLDAVEREISLRLAD